MALYRAYYFDLTAKVFATNDFEALNDANAIARVTVAAQDGVSSRGGLAAATTCPSVAASDGICAVISSADKIGSRATAWRGRSDLIDLGVRAFRTMQRAQAALRIVARQNSEAANDIEREYLAQEMKTALAWVEAASQEFMVIESAMSPESMRRLWEEIQNPGSATLR